MDKILMFLRKDNEIDVTSFINDRYIVEAYTDVVLALRQIKEIQPTIIIIDLATSRISGLELIRIIRSNPLYYHIKIIITAKNYNYKYLKLAFINGADYFVKYPFALKDIDKIYNGLKYLNEFSDYQKIFESNEFDLGIKSLQ